MHGSQLPKFLLTWKLECGFIMFLATSWHNYAVDLRPQFNAHTVTKAATILFLLFQSISILSSAQSFPSGIAMNEQSMSISDIGKVYEKTTSNHSCRFCICQQKEKADLVKSEVLNKILNDKKDTKKQNVNAGKQYL